jgi:transcriptional regulator with XRE-family HTH domain
MGTPKKKTLKEWRSERGVTQLQLAHETGLSLSAVVDIESFRKSPKIQTAEKLAKALGVELGDIRWTNTKE